MKDKVEIKVKAVIYNILPIKDYSIDNYRLKYEKLPDSIIPIATVESAIFLNNSLVSSLVNGKFGNQFKVLEKFESGRSSLFGISIDMDMRAVEYCLIDFYGVELRKIERKLRMISNLAVVIPSFILTGKLYRGDEVIEINISNISSRYSNFDLLATKHISQEEVLQRFKLNLDYDAYFALVEGSSKHACELFFSSFDVQDEQIAFILLFSSLESLFNADGKKISENVGEMVSKIMRLSTLEQTLEMKEKVKGYYKLRSKYIHGNSSLKISTDILIDFREIVRHVLLVYIMLSKSLSNYDIKVIMKYISVTPKNSYPPVFKIYQNLLNGDKLLKSLMDIVENSNISDGVSTPH